MSTATAETLAPPRLDPPPDAPLPASAPARTADAPTMRAVLVPPTRWPKLDFRELWKYRELFFYLVWRDVKVRYKQTVLGVAWAVLQPAMMMVVFTVFFHRLAGIETGGLPAPLFYLAGLLPWFFFQQSVNSSGGSVVGSEHLITKIYFPRLIIPIASVFAAVFDSLIAFVLLVVMWLYYLAFDDDFARVPNYQILFLPLVYVIIGMLAIGIGTLIAALNVVYRDVRYIVPFALQLGIFATPSIYMSPKGHEGRTLNLLAEINPMTALVSAYRSTTIGGPMPWTGVAIAAGAAVMMLVIGCLYFRKTEDRFADII
jgi:lipopolysaccharide transport system permease protein